MIGSESAFIFGTVGLLLALVAVQLVSGGLFAMLAEFRVQVMAGVLVFYLESWVAGGHWVRWVKPPRNRPELMGGAGALIGLTDGIIAAGVVSLALQSEPFAQGVWAGIYSWVLKPWFVIMLYGGLPVSLMLGTFYAKRVLKKIAELPPEES